MSVWKGAADKLTASSPHTPRCTLLLFANPVCRRPFPTKRALPCYESTPAWRRCCKRKTALRARKAAEDGDDLKVSTQTLGLLCPRFSYNPLTLFRLRVNGPL